VFDQDVYVPGTGGGELVNSSQAGELEVTHLGAAFNGAGNVLAPGHVAHRANFLYC
jgi:hypothetical protein